MSEVYVCGSINMDLVAFSPDLPERGETVIGTDFKEIPGGKGANQAIASARSGVTTYMAGCLGLDENGKNLQTYLVSSSVNCDYVKLKQGATTGVALIIVGNGENVIVVVPGANKCFDASDDMLSSITNGDVVMAQFETPVGATRKVFGHARYVGAKTILNTAPALKEGTEIFPLVDFLIMNETEFFFYTGYDFDMMDIEGSILRGYQACGLVNGQMLIITVGAEGAVTFNGKTCCRAFGYEVPVLDTTGAGDCFCGAFAARLAFGDSIDKALLYANAAAALSVGVIGAGTSMPTALDVFAFMNTSKKVLSNV